MSRMFADDFKELVRSRTDIVSLIGESVSLQTQRGGREFVGLCPFHDDHNPSFRVYPDRQSYRCWSCQEGGDCFSFVMRSDRLSFPEALEMLAQRAAIPLPESFRAQSPELADSKNRLYEVLAWAEQQFHECLLSSPLAAKAREYLASRNVNTNSIASYRLGYHPHDWNWLVKRAGRQFSTDQLHAVRLIGRREDSTYYDNFVDRVLFPIRDNRGRPVAFGGRILPGSQSSVQAKYWNSPDSVLFDKSRMLYGLEQARSAIDKTQTAIVMEGYTDCIMAHQFGVPNVVATLGTALTEQHVAALKRFARKVVLVYDGDAPGRNATEKALPKFLAQEVDLRILTLPGDQDPAEFLETHGAAAFQDLLEGASEAWDLKFRTVVERYGVDSIDARTRVLQEMLEILAQVPVQSGAGLAGTWQLRENIIVGRLAQRLTLSEAVVRQQLADARSQQPTAASAATRASSTRTDAPTVEVFPRKPSRDEWIERELLEIIFTAPEQLAVIRHEIQPVDLKNAALRKLLELCLELADADVLPDYEHVTAALEDPSLKALAAAVLEHARQVQVTRELVAHTLNSFRERRTTPPAPRMPATGRTLDETAELNHDARARLRLATELNQKRVTKKTLT